MTKMEKCKNFVKKHKWKIVAGLSLAAVGGIVYGVSKTSVKVDDIVEKALDNNDGYYPGWKKLDHDTIGIGEVADLDINLTSGYLEGIVNDISVTDIGKLGEELMKIDGVTEDKTVSVVFDVFDVIETE